MRACVRCNDAIFNRRQPFLVLHPSFAKQLQTMDLDLLKIVVCALNVKL